MGGLGGVEAGVGGEVDLGAVVAGLDAEAGEAGADVDALDAEPGGFECVLDCGEEAVDGVGCEAEEVEVAGSALDVAVDDQGGSAGEGEVGGLRPVGR